MTALKSAADIQCAAIEAAARWFVRMQTETNNAPSFTEWQQWLAASCDHRRAYEEIEDAALGARALPSSMVRLPTCTEMTEDAYDGSQSIAEWREKQKMRLPAARTWRGRAWTSGVRYALAASTAAALILGTWWLTRESAVAEYRSEIYRTAHGERQTVNLPDGSTVTLDADSALRVQYGEAVRLLQLRRGEAYFQVAKDVQRRFAVDAGSTQIVALGTAFNIRLSENRIVVAVTDGKVMVTAAPQVHDQRRQTKQTAAPPGGGARATPRATDTLQLVAQLSAGEAVAYSDNGKLQAMPATEAALATGWLDGRRQYRNEPLRYVLADIDRYTGQRIAIADEAAGELRFTGSLNLHNSAAWLQGLAVALPVRITELDGGDLSISLADRTR